MEKMELWCIACLYAATQKPDTIYLIGFDIVGKTYRNMYEGTLHYPRANSEKQTKVEFATKNQLFWTIRSFPDIQFRRVGGMALWEFGKFKNYKQIDKLPYEN